MNLVWIPIAVIAYTLLAGVQIIDRFILRETIKDPVAYVFAIGVATMAILPAAFFIFAWPGITIFLLALLSGLIFMLSLLPFFLALKDGEASRVIPAVGGLTTIFTFIFAAILLGEGLAKTDLFALAFLFLGYIFVTLEGPLRRLWIAIDWRIIVSAILLASSFVLRRAIYPAGDGDFEGFFSVFLLTALGMVLSSFLLLIPKKTRQRIIRAKQQAKPRHIGLIAGNQAGGAIAGFLINYAISIGPVAFVQATQGVQYVAIFVLSFFLANKFPRHFDETFTARSIGLKLGGTVSIATGLAILILV